MSNSELTEVYTDFAHAVRVCTARSGRLYLANGDVIFSGTLRTAEKYRTQYYTRAQLNDAQLVHDRRARIRSWVDAATPAQLAKTCKFLGIDEVGQ